jgi:hypothetical protein
MSLFVGIPDAKLLWGVSIEPGLALFREEFRTGKIIRRLVGEVAYNRLVEFAKHDETWPDLMKRLLDMAIAATAAPAAAEKKAG